MAHPSPLIANQLALVQQPISSTQNSHLSICNFAIDDSGAAGPQGVVNAWQGIWNTYIAPILSTTAVCEAPTVLYGLGNRTPQFAVATGATAAGADAGNFPPAQVSVLLKKITTLAGKRNRGRAYVPYMCAEANVGIDGRIQGGSLATMQTAADNVIAGLAGGGFDMVIANKVLVDNPSPPPLRYVDSIDMGPVVTTLFVEPVVATQRRRLVRL